MYGISSHFLYGKHCVVTQDEHSIGTVQTMGISFLKSSHRVGHH